MSIRGGWCNCLSLPGVEGGGGKQCPCLLSPLLCVFLAPPVIIIYCRTWSVNQMLCVLKLLEHLSLLALSERIWNGYMSSSLMLYLVFSRSTYLQSFVFAITLLALLQLSQHCFLYPSGAWVPFVFKSCCTFGILFMLNISKPSQATFPCVLFY